MPTPWVLSSSQKRPGHTLTSETHRLADGPYRFHLVIADRSVVLAPCALPPALDDLEQDVVRADHVPWNRMREEILRSELRLHHTLLLRGRSPKCMAQSGVATQVADGSGR
jgi:hypothetical protein